MRSSWSWISALALLALGVSCSGRGESDQEGAPATAVGQSAPTVGQRAGNVPSISARSYLGGSARVKVTGSFQIDADIAINTQASVSDGQMTWLQYGASGSDAPELTVTVSPDEVGIVVGLGKRTATIGGDGCSGSMEVTANSVAGQYACPGVTSYDSGAASLGKVDIEIKFTAKS